MNGDFSDAISKIRPLRRRSASSRRTTPVCAIGVETTVTAKRSSVVRQSATQGSPPWPGRVGDRHFELLGLQKFDEPAPHLAAAADDQGRFAGTVLRPDPRLL